MEPTNPLLPKDHDARIQALLAKMDDEERTEHGSDLDKQRKAWQHAGYLRYVIGPFLAGQLFDAWQWALSRIDDFLWRWAQETQVQNSPTITGNEPSLDPREALKRSLAQQKPEKTRKR